MALASCDKTPAERIESPDWAKHIATPVNLNVNDSCYLWPLEYFPAMPPILCLADPDECPPLTSVEISDGFTMEITDLSAIIIHFDSLPKHYGYLHFEYDGKHAYLPIVPKLGMEERLYTTGCEGNTFRFRFTVESDYRVECYIDNYRLDPQKIKRGNDGEYSVTIPDIAPGRHFARVFASDGNVRTNDLLIPLEGNKPVTGHDQLTRHDHEAQVLYSLLIDRFCNGNPGNDQPLNRDDVLPQVDYQGGDIKGVTQKIEEGFFDSLGITTIWISPVTQNPLDAWGQYRNPDTKFSGYHGYWPIYITQLDHRFSTDAEFRELLDTAHKHNMNVILDYVANHMHINSPTLQAHPDWVTDSIAPDGKPNFERWDDYRLTTWFDRHIPTLDLEKFEVCDQMTDSALYWVENYDLDGFRHDACKHIPIEYWKMFGEKLATRYPERDLWMIGETYGSPELIASYINSGLLNAQFDFNIYHSAIDAIGCREGHSMSDINDNILVSASTYGSHHTMGNISGNHDKARFISLAGGDLKWSEDPYKDAGWHRNVGVGDSVKGYHRSLLLEALNLTIPGVPCIYQGDEYGQAGANDPDNRRMMRFGGYNHYEQEYREAVEELIKLRRSNLALIYGEYLPVLSAEKQLAYVRTYMGKSVLVVLNNDTEAFTGTLKVPHGVLPDNLTEVQMEVGPMDYAITVY